MTQFERDDLGAFTIRLVLERGIDEQDAERLTPKVVSRLLDRDRLSEQVPKLVDAVINEVGVMITELNNEDLRSHATCMSRQQLDEPTDGHVVESLAMSGMLTGDELRNMIASEVVSRLLDRDRMYEQVSEVVDSVIAEENWPDLHDYAVRLAQRHLNDSTDADEVASEVMSRMLERNRLGLPDARNQVPAFVDNVIKEFARKRNRGPRTESALWGVQDSRETRERAIENQPGLGRTPSSHMAEAEHYQLSELALCVLSDSERAVYEELAQGATRSDVARSVGCDESTVTKRKKRADVKLNIYRLVMNGASDDEVIAETLEMAKSVSLPGGEVHWREPLARTRKIVEANRRTLGPSK